MKTLAVVLVLATVLLVDAIPKASGKEMICYYGSWAVYRPGAGKFDVEQIDPFICTQIIYGFTGLGWDNKMVVLDAYNDLYDNWGKGAMNRFVGLKEQNPNLKAIVAIGGWNEGSEKYSKMASSAASRAVFVQSVVEFLLKIGFDGLDLDWEYPANRGGVEADKENFILLAQELKAAFQPYGLMLTGAVSCGYATIDTAYNVPAVSATLDQIHLMCYDFHGGWEQFTGMNAPLYSNPDIDTGDNATWNADYAVNYWISKGASPSKLFLGMPLYGRGFTLDNPSVNGIYAPARNPIPAGPYTREAGFWGYNEICTEIATGGWTQVVDPYYQAPYMYKNNLWMGYDDAVSLAKKAEYVMSKGLGGAMIWSLETDDFTGSCSGTPFYLIKSIVATMNGGVLPTRPTPDPTAPTTTRRTTTVQTPPPTDICKKPGFVRDSNNCAIFYECIDNGQGGWIVHTYTCASGTFFDIVTSTCTWPENVRECDASGVPITTPASGTTSTTSADQSTAHTSAGTTENAGETSPPPVLTTPGSGEICWREGYVRDPNDCAIFYQCISNGQGGWIVYDYKCAAGTVFDLVTNTCTWPYLVPGCENGRVAQLLR